MLATSSAIWTLPSLAARCHVDDSATGANNGQSWNNAYSNLQSALTDIFCSEVWVAEGVYKPGTVREASFHIRPGTQVYGGFAGTESNLAARQAGANLAILSGDIDNNDDGHNDDGNFIDETSADIFGTNSYNVVTLDGTETPITSSTVLDGFTITGGQANNNYSAVTRRGGGLHCNGSETGGQCSPTLRNLHFAGNFADYGGATFNNGDHGESRPAFVNVSFSGNSATIAGGAMYNDGESGISSPTLTNVTFTQNSVDGYGEGGAMYNYGTNGTSSPVLVNVTFNGNNAYHGGAMYNYGSNGATYPDLTNVILWGNGDDNGEQIENASGSSTIFENCIVQGSGGSANWDSAIGFDGGGNLDADPQLGSLGMHRGWTPTMMPQRNGIALDTGHTDICPASDQRGVARPQANGCDIGAVELLPDLIFADNFEP